MSPGRRDHYSRRPRCRPGSGRPSRRFRPRLSAPLHALAHSDEWQRSAARRRFARVPGTRCPGGQHLARSPRSSPSMSPSHRRMWSVAVTSRLPSGTLAPAPRRDGSHDGAVLTMPALRAAARMGIARRKVTIWGDGDPKRNGHTDSTPIATAKMRFAAPAPGLPDEKPEGERWSVSGVLARISYRLSRFWYRGLGPHRHHAVASSARPIPFESDAEVVWSIYIRTVGSGRQGTS